jgi:hypothetical protein
MDMVRNRGSQGMDRCPLTGAQNEDPDFILASRRKVPAWRT